MANHNDEVRMSLAGGAGGNLICSPPPSWVEDDPWPSEVPDSAGSWTDDGVYRLLYEIQTSLLEPGAAQFVRVVQKVLTRAGAERASHVVLDFDPACERVEIHRIRIWRDQSYIDHARPDAIQLLRRETQLERLALNGRLTASVLVSDVRVDDLLEVAFTYFRDQPVLGGRHQGWIVFNCQMPWLETRYRICRPASRQLEVKAFNKPPTATIQTRDGVECSAWTAERPERRPAEDLVPSWTVMNPCYELSEFRDWGEVARLFEPHYRDGVPPADLQSELEKLARNFPEPAERAAEWLRFVQRELRYFALSLGEGGLIPRPVEVIWGRRYGDCKDAVRLYLAGARYLHLDANAALVSTTHGPVLETFLPGTHMFDHVIVQLLLHGETYWLDPTMQVQGGSLDKIIQPHLGWALPITSSTTGLKPLSDPRTVLQVDCRDSIILGARADAPARLQREMVVCGWTADDLRNQIRNDGKARVAEHLLRKLQDTNPGAVEKEPMAIKDDLNRNEITLTFGYELPNCWTPSADGPLLALAVSDTITVNELAPLQISRRRNDIYLGRPRRSKWSAKIEMPVKWTGQGWQQSIAESPLVVRSELSITGRTVTIQREISIDKLFVGPKAATDYERVIDVLRKNHIQIRARDSGGRIRPPARDESNFAAWFWVPWVVIALLSILGRLLGG